MKTMKLSITIALIFVSLFSWGQTRCTTQVIVPAKFDTITNVVTLQVAYEYVSLPAVYEIRTIKHLVRQTYTEKKWYCESSTRLRECTITHPAEYVEIKVHILTTPAMITYVPAVTVIEQTLIKVSDGHVEEVPCTENK